MNSKKSDFVKIPEKKWTVKKWFCKRFSGNKLVLSWWLISCASLNSFSRHLISRFFWYCEINASRKFHVTRRCGSVYLGEVVLRVWYFEHALLKLNNCHHILPEKINPLLYLFAEPHSLYSMSQSTTIILSFHDNVWKYAHLQCRHPAPCMRMPCPNTELKQSLLVEEK